MTSIWSRVTSILQSSIHLNSDNLHYGDIISLSIDNVGDRTGFFSANGIVDFRCGVTFTKEGELPQKFRECLFRVQYPNQYLAQKDLQTFMDSEEFSHESTEQVQKVNYLKERVKSEQEANKIEMVRRNGTIVQYGQFIQLYHLVSKKFLTIYKDTAELQKDSLLVALDEDGSTASYFQILSYYKFRTEGENVNTDDKVKFYNKKYDCFLNVSTLQYEDERFEVNANHLKQTRWALTEYYSASKNDINYLKSGDTVRLFHKEYEGYLMVNDTGPKNVTQLVSQNELAKYTSNSLWQIEFQDVTKGGQIEWNSSYRFLNVATGEYLCADLKDSADSLDFEDDDDYIPMTPNTPKTPSNLLFKNVSKLNFGKLDLSKVDSPKINTPKLAIEKEGDNEKKEEGGKKNASPKIDITQLKDPKSEEVSPETTPEVPRLQKLKPSKSFAQKISSLSTLKSFSNEKPFIPKTSFLMTPRNNSVPETPLSTQKYTDIGYIFTRKDAVTDHWCFFPPSNDVKGPISFGSYAKIRHFESETWIHPSITLTNERNKKEKEKSRNKPIEVCTSLKSIIEDTFQIQKVTELEIDNLFIIQSLQLPLLQFIDKISNEEKRKNVTAKDILPTQHALVKLLKFITKSPLEEKQILHKSATFDGVPTQTCQNILRERKFLDSCLNILQLCFDYQLVNQSSVNLPENKTFQKTFQLAYCTLRLASKNNPENGVYMAKYVKLMQKQIAYDIGASDALFYILKDNYDLLTNIDTSSIDFFIDELKNHDKNSRMLLFLSTLCNVNDLPVSQNQDYIIERLVDHKVIQKILILPYIDSDGKVFVFFNGKKVDFVTFTTEPSYAKLVSYFKETIELLSRVCIGRNSISISIVNEMVMPKIISRCIANNEIPKVIRTHFVNLMIHTHVTGEPFEKRPLCPLTRIWSRIEMNRKRDKYEITKSRDFEELKDFIFKYFKESSIRMIDVLKNEENEFTLALLNLLKRMIDYGIYPLDELLSLIPFLYALLDEINYTYNMDTSKRRETKYKNNEINHQTCEIKIEVLNIFERILDLDTSHLIEKTLSLFKAEQENYQIYETKHVKHMFKNDSAFSKISIQDFELCLIDTLKFENTELSSKALHVLFRFRTRKEDLVEKLSKVELLVSKDMVRAYNSLSNVYIKLRNLMTGSLSSSEFSEAYEYITFMLEDIKKPEKQFFDQTVLRNLDFQRLSIMMLKKKYQVREHKFKIFECIFQIIKYFVKDNPKNQSLMFPHLEFLISKLGPLNHIWECIIEIVRNNISLCSTIEEKLVQNYIQFMAESNPPFQPPHLDFLSAIVVVGNVPIKRNQSMVIKALIERKNDVMILFNDEEGLKERNELLLADDLKNENGKLSYYCKLLELLTLCCKGKVHATEIQIQSIFTIDEVIIQLKDEHTPQSLQYLLFKFLDEIFIHTEKKNQFVTTNQSLWETIDHFTKDLNQKVIKNDFKSLDLEFVFVSFPMFLFYYFSIHYEHKGTKEGTVKLIKMVYEMLRATTTKSEYRATISNLIQILDYKLSNTTEYIPIDHNMYTQNMKVTTLEREDPSYKKVEEDSKIASFGDFVAHLSPIIMKESDLIGFSEYYLSNPYFHFYDDLVVPIVNLIEYLIEKKEKFTETILRSLRSLQHLINRSNEENQEEIQNTLAKCGVTTLCLNLMKVSSHEVVGEAYKLAISLADGGNKLVQQQIYDYFLADTEGSIFISIRDRIRKAISEIKDKKSFIKREREKEVAYYQTLSSNGNLRIERVNFVLEQFNETGHIQDILRFLQLTCEGHNIHNQEYLNFQKKALKSIDLVSECLSYIIHLKKYIDYSNIKIAMQCFDSLTEFIQGPCVKNQTLLNQTQLYTLANDLLGLESSIEIEKSYDDNMSLEDKYIRNLVIGVQDQHVEKNLIKYQDLLELKSKIVTCLISVISESRVESIAELMRNTLNIEIIYDQMRKLLSRIENKEIIEKQLENEMRSYILYNFEEYSTINFEDSVSEILEKEEELAYQYYILLNYLATFDESNGFIRKQLDKMNEKEFKVLEQGTGKIEVLRNDKLEKIYFKIPEVTKSLSKETKREFIKSCPRETPQQKVAELFRKTPLFLREMEYLSENNKSFLFRVAYRLKRPLLILQLLISIICNLIVFFTMAITVEVDASANSVIPIPGITTNIDKLPKSQEFAEPVMYSLFLAISIIQLFVLVIRFTFHLIYELPLIVRKKYPTKGVHEKWNVIVKNETLNLVLKTIQYIILDVEIWSIILIFTVTLVSIFQTPAIVSLQTLFEIIALSSTIRKYLRSLYQYRMNIFLTFLFLLITINTFLTVSFFSFNEWYFLTKFEGNNIPRQRYYICDTMLNCFYFQVNYAFRALSSIEAIFPTFRYTSNALALFHWLYIVGLYTINNIVLLQIFLGIILQAFADMRAKKAEILENIEKKCFICDIEKARFDLRAHRGIDFEYHRNKEHELWDYVAYVIYLKQKSITELSGMEQYLSDLIGTEKDVPDLSFFPCLRAMVLEDE